MQYFSILNFKEEPFSNSPQPSLMYLSKCHNECLQQLELSVRLKRGLAVVIGDVGLGKSTLCRALLQRLEAPDTEQKIKSFLFLDSYFETSKDFLRSFAQLIYPDTDFADFTEAELKECIKSYIFMQYEQGVIVVLLLDEGQKMTKQSLETIREMLNFETNEQKLLQIIIFAQKEFEAYIKSHPNFADRINLLYHLKPMSFFETRQMILQRIKLCSVDGSYHKFFTLPALIEIYRLTNGYPRAIVNLCHHCLLALIIQNKRVVTKALVSVSASRIALKKSSNIAPYLLATFAGILLTLSAFYLWQSAKFEHFFKPFLKTDNTTATTNTQTTMPDNHSVNNTKNSGQLHPDNTTPSQEPSKPPLPDTLGTIKVKQGETISNIAKFVYGSSSAEIKNAIAQANPKINKETFFIYGNSKIVLPAITNSKPASEYPRYMIKLAEFDEINRAYNFVRLYPAHLPKIAIMPCLRFDKGMSFIVVIGQGFKDNSTAQDMLLEIPEEISNTKAITAVYPECDVHYRRW